jgi:two-component system, OmpR family, sensor kinase
VLALAVPGAIDQVLDNLIANSLDVSATDGAITIGVVANDSHVIVTVTDEGPGMTADERAHAFDRFWHGRRVRRDGGTGLGLAIVRQLVLASGGLVELAEPDGGGLRVTVVLDAATGPAVA